MSGDAGPKAKRIFLSSTCLDLEDLRSGLKESLEEMGYQVWASEFPDFPVDSNLHSHDNCLRNVERADQYVLIVSDRYGALYDGAAYPKCPLKDAPKRRISITWYEYLRALELRKPIRILVRERIWDQRTAFQSARKAGAAQDLPAELFDFLEFVCGQPRANWINHFRDFPEAKRILAEGLRQEQAQNARQFEREVRELLLLQRYRGFDSEPTGVAWFLAESGDTQVPIQWAVRCVFQPQNRPVRLSELKEFFTEFGDAGYDRALVVTNTDFEPEITSHIGARAGLARKVKLSTPGKLLGGLLNLDEYVRRVREDYHNYRPGESSRYLPLRTNLKKYFVPLECKGDYEGDLFECIDRFLADPEVNHLSVLGDFGTGKSCCAMELTIRLLERGSSRIPLFFSLRDYQHVETLQSIVTKGAHGDLRRSGVRLPRFPAAARGGPVAADLRRLRRIGYALGTLGNRDQPAAPERGGARARQGDPHVPHPLLHHASRRAERNRRQHAPRRGTVRGARGTPQLRDRLLAALLDGADSRVRSPARSRAYRGADRTDRPLAGRRGHGLLAGPARDDPQDLARPAERKGAAKPGHGLREVHPTVAGRGGQRRSLSNPRTNCGSPTPWP